jgi:hypothetical protein
MLTLSMELNIVRFGFSIAAGGDRVSAAIFAGPKVELSGRPSGVSKPGI